MKSRAIPVPLTPNSTELAAIRFRRVWARNMLRHPLPVLLWFFFLTTTGCDADKIARLEKENQELKAASAKDHASADYDLQAKCSRDAKAWFNENWAGSRDKDTILLDYTNHHDKSENKCFIQVEYHYNFLSPGSWVTDIMLWDVYENAKYGTYSETHLVYQQPYRVEDHVVYCELLGKKCQTVEQYNALVQPYMNN